jgi:hypothetical protein
MAAAIARFRRALHQPVPHDAPHNPWRGVALATRTKRVQEHVRQLSAFLDTMAVLNLWEDVSARGWALALALAYLAHSRDDEAMGALGRATLDAALNDST